MSTPNDANDEVICYIPSGPQAGETRKLKEAACFTATDAVEPTEHICIGPNVWHNTNASCEIDDGTASGAADTKGSGTDKG